MEEAYRLRVRSHFSAVHHLVPYQGGAEPSHHHRWTVEAVLEKTELDEQGIAYDFVAIRRILDGLTSRFDHGEINLVPPFDRRSPTAEHLAAWFFGELSAALPDVPWCEVTVWEGPSCSASYRSSPRR